MSVDDKGVVIGDIIRTAEYVERSEKFIIKSVLSKYFVLWGLLFEIFVLLNLIFSNSLNYFHSPSALIMFSAYFFLAVLGGAFTSRHFKKIRGYNRFIRKVMGISLRRFSLIVSVAVYSSLTVYLSLLSYYAITSGHYYLTNIAGSIFDIVLGMIPVYIIVIVKSALDKVPLLGYFSAISFLFSILLPIALFMNNGFSSRYAFPEIEVCWVITGIIWMVTGISLLPDQEGK